MKVLLITESDMSESEIVSLFSHMYEDETEEFMDSEFKRFLNGEQVVLRKTANGISTIEKMGTNQ